MIAASKGQLSWLLVAWILVWTQTALAKDLDEIVQEGVLRHLGIPYANFVTGSGDGLDVELIRGFAAHLGVRYEFIPSAWDRVFGDLTGQHARRKGSDAERYGETGIRGDLIANGMTILDWRRQAVTFSQPTFPSGVWLVAPATSSLRPIEPTGGLDGDIRQTKSQIDGVSVLALANTCLDPGLYDLAATGAEIRLAPAQRRLNEMIPALLNQDAESTLLDVPDALMALQRWPGEIKVVGPISEQQHMAVAFRPESTHLLKAFDSYLLQVRADGSYNRLVQKYYPGVFDYYAGFFRGI